VLGIVTKKPVLIYAMRAPNLQRLRKANHYPFYLHHYLEKLGETK